MGLLDWLMSDTGGMGSGPSPGAMSNPMGDMTGVDQSMVPQAAPQMPVGQDTAPTPPPAPQVPLPQARPAGADAGQQQPPPLPAPISVAPAGAPDASMLPQGATETQGYGGPADILKSYRANGGGMAPPTDTARGGDATGILGRAFGLDANRERSVKASLASGLKSVGENSNKPGLAAFSGSLGSGMEGGAKADKDTTSEQSKYLNDAIKAQAVGDTRALNVARTKLAVAQAKAVGEGKDSKASVMNSKEQLYLRGLGAVNQDVKVKASAANLKALAVNGTDTPEYKAAQKTHDDLISDTKKSVFGTLGVDEKSMKEIGQKEGFSADKPIPAAGLTKDKFDQLPPGAYFINPKDGQLLQKKAPAATPNGTVPPVPNSPAPVTAPAGSSLDSEE